MNYLSFPSDYDFQLEYVVETLLKVASRKVLLQFPDGLKPFAISILKLLREKANAEFIISAESTYGACDLAIEEAKMIGADTIIHFGHSEYTLSEVKAGHEGIKVFYVPVRYMRGLDDSIKEQLRQQLEVLGAKKVALASTIQHVHLIGELKSFLKSFNIEPITYTTPPMVEGQIIGCDYTSVVRAKSLADVIVVVAGGKFHALGAGLATMLPVVKVDPYTGKVYDFTSEVKRFLAIRYSKIYAAKEARNWGVLIGAKSGQYRPFTSMAIKRTLESAGRNVYVFISRQLTINELRNIDSEEIEAYVVTSCPRLPVDDFGLSDFEKPVLTPGEVYMILQNDLDRYRFPW